MNYIENKEETNKDDEAEYLTIKQKAEAGDAESQYSLAMFYKAGKHLIIENKKIKNPIITTEGPIVRLLIDTTINVIEVEDKILTFEWLIKSANQGFYKAQSEILNLFDDNYEIENYQWLESPWVEKADYVNEFIETKSLRKLFDPILSKESLTSEIKDLKDLVTTSNIFALEVLNSLQQVKGE
jgi:TPR repeat protein